MRARASGKRRLCASAAAIVVLWLPAVAPAHNTPWYESLSRLTRYLEPLQINLGGYYAGEAIYIVKARCRGILTPPPIIKRGVRYYEHFDCTVDDARRRTWTFRFHVTGRQAGDWVVTAVQCVQSRGRTPCP